MRKIMLLLACSCAIAAASCKKNKQNPTPPPPDNQETVKVRIRLTGDILLSESQLPNGRKAGNGDEYAKILRDSTIYAVMIKNGWQTIHSGLFNRPDSISIELPATGESTIVVNAYKRGTGFGLFYTLQPNGKQYFNYPFESTITNRMDTTVLGRRMLDTMSVEMTNPLDTTRSLNWSTYPEIDAYRGAVTYNANNAPAIISLSMKRMAFGIRLSSPNFTSGKLIAEFPGGNYIPQPIIVTPANINSQYHIYSADQFKYADSLYWGNGLTVKLKWEKPDGSFVPLGEKAIKFKRNVLTNIQVTIVDAGRSAVTPVITETDWSNTEIINL